MPQNIQKIGVIGSGNVAWHLAHGLKDADLTIPWIYSRNQVTGKELANALHSDFVDQLNCSDVDLCLVCTNDDAVQTILDQVDSSCYLAFTAGARSLHSMHFGGNNLGVFYPLQTFSKDRAINLFEVPFFIEAKNTDFAQSLFDLAWRLSRKVHFADSEERKKLHVAAVLVNNFTNHLAYLAEDFLKKNELSFEHLKPLMNETMRKMDQMSLYDAQTGPARRKDELTIASHLNMLDGDTKLLYELFTKSIQKTYSNE